MDYFKYNLENTLGLICSSGSNAVYAGKDKYAVCGALENVYVWNLRTGEIVHRWSEYGNKAEVTRVIGSTTNADIFAVGYSDGTVRVWSLKENAAVSTFSGHKTSITALAFDVSATKLASASREGDIVIWDLVAETGLFRLHAHSNAVTGICFSPSGKTLISTSKDCLLKVWDLATQHCVETSVIHHAEITSIAVSSDGSRIFTAGADKSLRLLEFNEESVSKAIDSSSATNEVLQPSATGSKVIESGILKLVETVVRSSSERAVHLELDASEKYLACLGADKSLEIWKFKKPSANDTEGAEQSKSEKKKSAFKQVRHARLSGKAASVVFCPSWKISSQESVKLLVAFNDNQLTELLIPLNSSEATSEARSIESAGHRGEPKVVSLSPSASLLATAAKNMLKVWNPRSGSMLRTVEVDATITIALFIDEQWIVAGDESGLIHLIDLTSGDVVDSSKAHDGAIRCAAMKPNMKGMLTGGADKVVKFWEFKSTTPSSNSSASGKKLKMIKNLQMKDEITALKYSPDLRFIAVATLDLTVKVFHEDTLRFFLSLYGHKLPITSVDISHDGKTLISASADKNIKVWSLEFGDCRKSIFAHHEAITGVSFLPESKLFLSCSKDGFLKFWDCEKFLELQKLSGHHADVWAMTLSQDGRLLVSVSKDRSIKVWMSGDEQLFPEEEKEIELEEQFEKSIIEDNPMEVEKPSDEADKATTTTIMSMKHGERIMEAIEAADDFRRKMDEYDYALSKNLPAEKPTPEGLYLALGRDKSPADLVLSIISRIPLPDLEEALLCLPNVALPSLLLYAREWLQSKRNVVVSSRIVDILLRLFHKYILANPPLYQDLMAIKDLERQTLEDFKDILGFNNIAIKMNI